MVFGGENKIIILYSICNADTLPLSMSSMISQDFYISLQVGEV